MQYVISEMAKVLLVLSDKPSCTGSCPDMIDPPHWFACWPALTLLQFKCLNPDSCLSVIATHTWSCPYIKHRFIYLKCVGLRKSAQKIWIERMDVVRFWYIVDGVFYETKIKIRTSFSCIQGYLTRAPLMNQRVSWCAGFNSLWYHMPLKLLSAEGVNAAFVLATNEL